MGLGKCLVLDSILFDSTFVREICFAMSSLFGWMTHSKLGTKEQATSLSHLSGIGIE